MSGFNPLLILQKHRQSTTPLSSSLPPSTPLNESNNNISTSSLSSSTSTTFTSKVSFNTLKQRDNSSSNIRLPQSIPSPTSSQLSNTDEENEITAIDNDNDDTLTIENLLKTYNTHPLIINYIHTLQSKISTQHDAILSLHDTMTMNSKNYEGGLGKVKVECDVLKVKLGEARAKIGLNKFHKENSEIEVHKNNHSAFEGSSSVKVTQKLQNQQQQVPKQKPPIPISTPKTSHSAPTTSTSAKKQTGVTGTSKKTTPKHSKSERSEKTHNGVKVLEVDLFAPSPPPRSQLPPSSTIISGSSQSIKTSTPISHVQQLATKTIPLSKSNDAELLDNNINIIDEAKRNTIKPLVFKHVDNNNYKNDEDDDNDSDSVYSNTSIVSSDDDDDYISDREEEGKVPTFEFKFS